MCTSTLANTVLQNEPSVNLEISGTAYIQMAVPTIVVEDMICISAVGVATIGCEVGVTQPLITPFRDVLTILANSLLPNLVTV